MFVYIILTRIKHIDHFGIVSPIAAAKVHHSNPHINSSQARLNSAAIFQRPASCSYPPSSRVRTYVLYVHVRTRRHHKDSYSFCQALYFSTSVRADGLVCASSSWMSSVWIVSRCKCRSLPARAHKTIGWNRTCQLAAKVGACIHVRVVTVGLHVLLPCTLL